MRSATATSSGSDDERSPGFRAGLDWIGDAVVRAVVPGHGDDRGLSKIERGPKRREQLARARDREASHPEGPCQLDEPGVPELGRERAPVYAPLVRLDHAVTRGDVTEAHCRRP